MSDKKIKSMSKKNKRKQNDLNECNAQKEAEMWYNFLKQVSDARKI